MFSVPEYSQYLDIVLEEWKSRSCGIVSLQMILEYTLHKKFDGDELIKRGLALDGFILGVGWKHQALVDIAHDLGCDAQRYDWVMLDDQEALGRLKEMLMVGPIIVSIYSNLDPSTKNGHLVVVTGIERGKVFYNDPATKIREDIKRSAPIEEFMKGWKKRAILISKKN